VFISKREKPNRFAFEGGRSGLRPTATNNNNKTTSMKKCLLHGIALAATAGLALGAHAQATTDQSQFPAILQQPVDQCLPMGAPATFAVDATNADSYQWYCNGMLLDGETNSSTTIPSVSINNVGYYSASVIRGSEAVPTRPANLNAYIMAGSASTITPASMQSAASTSSSPSTTTMTMSSFDLGSGGPITVFGSPVVSSGGSGSCPGKYSGYVNFTKTAANGWGWAPSTNTTIHTATDTNQTITKVQALGDYGDSYCNQTTATVQNPPMSPVYRFTIYFPTNTTVPTNPYPITLNGFDP
jgi:hypothetical protein